MTKLSKNLIKELTGYIADVGFGKIACGMCEITTEELDKWLEEADKEDASSLHLLLKKEVRKARAIAEYNPAMVVVHAYQEGNLEAAKLMLKTLAPERWDVKNENARDDDGNINIVIKTPTCNEPNDKNIN